MEAKRRQLEWVEGQNFHGWACSECDWVFNPEGPPVGESIDEMISNYEERRDKEFTSHVCAQHPKAKNPKR
jgi:rubredoxin